MASPVIIFDKVFEKHIPSHRIAERVREIATRMNEELRDTNPVFMPILNGAFFFAADLLRLIEFPYEMSFVKIASYTGTKPEDAINILLGPDENLAERNIIIIEDIVDTGRTIYELCHLLKKIPVLDIKIASLIFKPTSLRYQTTLDYIGFESGDEFLIGYGLDFDGKGRHYKDIYKLKGQ